MKWIEFQPTFKIAIEDSPEAAIEKLREEYNRRGSQQGFVMNGEYGELHLPRSEHRIWSPYLSFYLYESQGVHSIYGRFSPRMHILTFVWFIYFVMAVITFFSCALASSQLFLGQPMWGIWVAIAALSVIAILYVVAHIGQQYSADQMKFLRSQLEEILQSAEIRCCE